MVYTLGSKSSKFPYPKRVFFIIGTELCERFNYYGMISNFFFVYLCFGNLSIIASYSNFYFTLCSNFGDLPEQ